MADVVLLDVQDKIARVTINRHDQRNAVNIDVCHAMRSIFDEIERDKRISVTVLRGGGEVFCAGMDLKAFADGDGEDILFGQYGFAGFVKRQRRKPVIAEVQGAALAGGFEIMLACDMVIAAANARFGLPEAKLGLVAGAGGGLRLAQRIPRVRANEILLTGKTFGAEVALELGLLNAVVPKAQTQNYAIDLATEIAANAPQSVAESLALSDAAFREIEDWETNDQKLREIGKTADAREGARAFMEKRKPRWNG
jgi:enoyl-CoA hydratase